MSKDLRAIYTQPTEEMARQKFEEFKAKRGRKYPQVIEEWERDWEVIMTFLSNTNVDREFTARRRR